MGVFRTRAYAAARGGTAGKQHVQAAQPREQPQQAASDEQEWLSFANAAQPATTASSSAAAEKQHASVAESGGIRSIPVVVLARRRDAGDGEDGLAAVENETDEERLQRLNQIVLAAKLRKKDAKAMQRASASELAAATDVFRVAQVARDAELMRKR
jgi:hypothetical protein